MQKNNFKNKLYALYSSIVLMINNIRFMTLNPDRFGPENSEKIKILCQKVIDMEIDIIMLSAPNRWWATNIVESIKRQFKQINKNVEIVATNSRENTNSISGWLLGGTITILLGRTAGILKINEIIKEKKGRQSAFTLEENNISM